MVTVSRAHNFVAGYLKLPANFVAFKAENELTETAKSLSTKRRTRRARGPKT